MKIYYNVFSYGIPEKPIEQYLKNYVFYIKYLSLKICITNVSDCDLALTATDGLELAKKR